MDNNQLTPALEDYLEAIFQISKMHKVARSMEIADMMKVKRSSVTIALRSLAEKGLINYQVRSFVTLTDAGLKIARCVSKRHSVLHNLFTKVLGLSHATASSAACNMEHGMTSEVCRKMTALLSVLKKDTVSAHKLISDVEANAQKINCQNTCWFSDDNDTFDREDSEVLTLNELESGESGEIVKIIGVSSLKLRLQEMGFVRGQKVLVVKAAPLDDPIEVAIRSSHVSLRRGEAGMVLVKKL